MTNEAPPARAGDQAAQLLLFGASPAGSPSAAEAPAPPDPDRDARAYAVDPRHNVVLEASAGTGKTSVLVARYVNLLKAGVDPANILAITFTRKAAAEMRERIVGELRRAADGSELDKARWRELRDRLSEIAISTIDAFCLSLLREFPLEADVDPGFDLADETEVPRLVGIALDRTLRIAVGLARADADVALVLAQLGISRTRQGLAMLLGRRLVARDALDRFLAREPRGLTAAGVCRAAARALQDALVSAPGGLPRFLADGPGAHPRYELFLRAVRMLALLDMPRQTGQPSEAGEAGEHRECSDAAIRTMLDRIAGHFLTNEGKARKGGSVIPPYKAGHYPSKDAAKRHRDALFEMAPRMEQVMWAFNRDLNVVLARGTRRVLAVALAEYRQALEERSLLDFSDVLERALELLRRMDEFSQSRFRLESRYHHVLVDEFQDTSRAQWELVSLLVEAWGQGCGVAASPSIFIVGDRKQSIYRFRDAEVAVLQQAGRYVEGLRPGGGSRRSIVRSFRAVPELLHFVNDVFSEMSQPALRPDGFTYDDRDRFPVDAAEDGPDAAPRDQALGVAVAESPEACAAAVADEIARLLRDGTVRDKGTGVTRPVRPGDIAILFRSRSSHREFERELGARGIATYVYKGLGFFDADEIKDLTALLRYLAEPTSALRAAAFLRSRFIRISDRGLAALAPDIPGALLSEEPLPSDRLDGEDRTILEQARTNVREWLADVDRVTPAELLDRILADTAYAWELGGVRRRQAWENVKKLRGLVRRIQNRGYTTLRRIAEHLMSMTAGDESNAIVEALDAVNLMTVHAAKGLEFPIVFVVNLARGASGPPQPVRIVPGGPGDAEEAGDQGAGQTPLVAIGPFLAETDEAERDHERHETRRLLYVALTRARDRLYLATILKDGALVPGRGSLAEVLPESLKPFFGRALAVVDEVETIGWTGLSGLQYRLRVCRIGTHPAAEMAVEGLGAAPPPGQADDFARPAATDGLARLSATDHVNVGADYPHRDGEPRSDRLLGVLIHRLFEWADRLEGPPDHARVAALALRMLRPGELALAEDDVAEAAAEAWMRARSRADVAEALAGAERLHEVPFSLRLPADPLSCIVRGTIDCLVRKTDGAFTVVELKTGQPQEAHERQLELYVRAARAFCAGAPVEGVLIYV